MPRGSPVPAWKWGSLVPLIKTARGPGSINSAGPGSGFCPLLPETPCAGLLLRRQCNHLANLPQPAPAARAP